MPPLAVQMRLYCTASLQRAPETRLFLQALQSQECRSLNDIRCSVEKHRAPASAELALVHEGRRRCWPAAACRRGSGPAAASAAGKLNRNLWMYTCLEAHIIFSPQKVSAPQRLKIAAIACCCRQCHRHRCAGLPDRHATCFNQWRCPTGIERYRESSDQPFLHPAWGLRCSPPSVLPALRALGVASTADAGGALIRCCGAASPLLLLQIARSLRSWEAATACQPLWLD